MSEIEDAAPLRRLLCFSSGDRAENGSAYENGYRVHNAPIGYVYREIKGRRKVLFLDPPLNDYVQQAFEGYASGHFRTVAEVRRFVESIPEFPRSKTGRITR